MDKVTQQNAANAEESASASEELKSQAGQMKGVVAQLVKLLGGDQRSVAERGKLSLSDKPLHDIARGRNNQTKAESIIPFHEDEAEQDINAFNT